MTRRVRGNVSVSEIIKTNLTDIRPPLSREEFLAAIKDYVEEKARRRDRALVLVDRDGRVRLAIKNCFAHSRS